MEEARHVAARHLVSHVFAWRRQDMLQDVCASPVCIKHVCGVHDASSHEQCVTTNNPPYAQACLKPCQSAPLRSPSMSYKSQSLSHLSLSTSMSLKSLSMTDDPLQRGRTFPSAQGKVQYVTSFNIAPPLPLCQSSCHRLRPLCLCATLRLPHTGVRVEG